MFKVSWLVRAVLLGVAILAYTSQLDSAVIGKAKDEPDIRIKSFTGILSGPGSPGTSPFPKTDYVDFICDPRLLNWHIEVIRSGKNRTKIIGNPRVCEHVEVVMYYYSPPVNGFQGTAISIRKID